MKDNKFFGGWTIVIDHQLPYRITVEGQGAERIDISKDRLNIVLKGKYYDHVLVDKSGNKVILYATQANIVPCYYRTLNGKLHLSNIGSNLLIEKKLWSWMHMFYFRILLVYHIHRKIYSTASSF